MNNVNNSIDLDANKEEVRYDLLNILYAGMLLYFSTDEIRSFWKDNLLPGFTEKNEFSMFSELWQSRKWYSQNYVFSVLTNFELFLISKGWDCFDFIEKTFFKINKGLLIPPRDWLSLSKPLLSTFFSDHDIRFLVLKYVNFYLKSISKTYEIEVVSHKTEANWNYTTLLFHNVRNKNPLKTLPKYDCELWTAHRIKGLVVCANIPVFENYYMVADHRQVTEIIEDTVCKATTMYLNGSIIADKISFDDFCSQNKLNLSQFDLPQSEVWVMRADVLCPVRKRVVLHKDCAYGAPGYLFTYKYAPSIKVPNNFLDSIIDDVSHFNDGIWAQIVERHNRFIKILSQKAAFIYNRKHDLIQLNGKYLIKNVPAKILRKILAIHLTNGRTEFSHSEFIKDESIIDNELNPNFVIRLQRLTKALEQSNSGISIRKVERGRFSLIASCAIEFSECN